MNGEKSNSPPPYHKCYKELNQNIIMGKVGDEVGKEIDRVMNDIIDKVFAKSQENLLKDGKIDTGTLFKTAGINRSFLEKEIVYPVPYASDIEFGRVPGTMPPSSALHKWVKRKLGITNENKIKSVAFAIATAIKKRGILPTPFMRNAWDEVKKEMKL